MAGDAGVPTEALETQARVVQYERDTMPLRDVRDEADHLRRLIILHGDRSPEFRAAERIAEGYDRPRLSGTHTASQIYGRVGFEYEKDGRRVSFTHEQRRLNPDNYEARELEPERFDITTHDLKDPNDVRIARITVGQDLNSEDGDNNVPVPPNGPVIQFSSREVYYRSPTGKKLPVRNTPIAVEEVTAHIEEVL